MMKRDLQQMAAKEYDLIVVGGGITGACVAWDASLRGLKVALVEKNDFSHATSSATSKLIHGGLRYLKNMELSLVRESLSERRTLELIAPHLVYPIPFLVPSYGWGKRGKVPLLFAMVLYDVLSFDKQRLNDEEKRIPTFKNLSKEQTLALEPGLEARGLTGGTLYHDCQMYSGERLTLEFILSAAEYGADLANYAEVTGFLQEGNRVKGVKVYDHLEDREASIHGKLTINVAGPWADLLLGLIKENPQRGLIRSKGIHLITKPIVSGHALVLYTPGGRHFFIIPWRAHSLIGTTDKIYQGHPDSFRVTEEDITEFLKEINASYPSAQLRREDVLAFYGGLRPIVDSGTEAHEISKASRKYEIYDHKEEGLEGFLTAIGGKYTTSRHLAQKLVDLACKKINEGPRLCRTHFTPLYGSEMGTFSTFNIRMIKRYAPLPAPVISNLCRNYGSKATEVLALGQEDPALLEPIAPQHPDIMAEVVYGVRHEMARSLSDILFRRTGVGTLGHPGEKVMERVAEKMAHLLGWDVIQKDREIDRALAWFIPQRNQVKSVRNGDKGDKRRFRN